MNRRGRGARVARAQALIVLAAVAVACVPQVPPTPTPVPTATLRLPTPVPTVEVTPAPTPTEVVTEARILILLESCGHTCGPSLGTTIYEDGRVIWADLFQRPLEGRLKPEFLQEVRDAVEATGALDEDAAYQAELRPRAEPVGRGATSHRFERDVGNERVVVNSANADDYLDDRELWIIPPEVEVLSDLAARLADPLAWLGLPAFLEEPRPYQAERYLVMISPSEFGDPDEHDVDADEIDWPWGGPIEAAGEPFELGDDGPRTRCLAITAEDAKAMVEAEIAGGGERRDLLQWQAFAEYGWRRGGGSVTVETLPLLPHQAGTCDEVFTFVGEVPPA
jgi:hypothetical protein